MHEWATKLSQAIPIVVYAPEEAETKPGATTERLKIVRRLQAWGVPIVLGDPQLETVSYAHLRERIDEEVQQAVADAIQKVKTGWGNAIIEETEERTALPIDPTTAPVGTLYRTIDQCKLHVEQTGLTPNFRKRLERMDMLKEHHADCQLWQLDFNAIEKMVTYWRGRPKTKRGNRCSPDHASKMMQEVIRYLKWLDKQPRYRWTMPRDVNDLERSPISLPEDDAKHSTAFHSTIKETYSPEELAAIARQTDAFGRAMIGVCVNCAFGASEVGQCAITNYHLLEKHPHAAALNFTTTDADSWIVGKRPKTGFYGEHLLWPEVAAAVKPFLDGRPVLPMTAIGKPLYRPDSKNAQSGFAGWWKKLLDCAEQTLKKKAGEDKTFRRLPFGSLRDLLPNILRREYSDEIASLCLQHGELGDDDLLNCYANLPFGRLFTATQDLHGMFKPFLETLT